MIFAEFTSNEWLAIIAGVSTAIVTVVGAISSMLAAYWTAKGNAEAQRQRELSEIRTGVKIDKAAHSVAIAATNAVETAVAKSSDGGGR